MQNAVLALADNRNGVTLSDSLHQPLLARSLLLPYYSRNEPRAGPCALPLRLGCCLGVDTSIHEIAVFETECAVFCVRRYLDCRSKQSVLCFVCSKCIKGSGQVMRGLCTSRFTAVPVGLYGMCGQVSEKQMDRSRGSYTFPCAIPTHTDSPRQSGGARKELGVLREWITFSICRAQRHFVQRGEL